MQLPPTKASGEAKRRNFLGGSHMSLRPSFRRVTVILSVIWFTLAAQKSAHAQVTVTLNYQGASNNSGGVFVYPYNFTINDSEVDTQLMCDDFVHEIDPPTTWQASALPVVDLVSTANLQYPNDSVQTYLEAAYLFGEEVNAYNDSNSDPNGYFNWAVWDLMTGVDESAVPLGANDAIVQGYLNAAEAEGPSLTPSDFPTTIIFTPIPPDPATEETPDSPQEFMGMTGPGVEVPEPCSFGILALGTTGLLARRKRSASR
jgi:hypothetical protein